MKSAQLFFRGPVWAVAALASAVSTGIGIYQSIRGEPLWPWLFGAALAIAIASFISFHLHRVRSESGKEGFRAKVDVLVRQGFDRQTELSKLGPEPVEDEKGHQRFPMWPPESKWDPVVAYDEEVRVLLYEYDPGLLIAYADGVNAARKKVRRRERQMDRAQEGLPLAEQMDRMIKRNYHKPADDMETLVSGLVAARGTL